MDKKEILADLRAQFGNVTVLYAKDIVVLLGSPSTGAVYELIKRGGLPFPVKMIGGRPAVSIYDVADWLAGDVEPKAKKADPMVKGKAVLPKPAYTVNKAMAKAMSALRGQRNFLFEVDAELEKMLIANERAAKAKAEAKADTSRTVKNAGQPKKSLLAKKTLKSRTDII